MDVFGVTWFIFHYIRASYFCAIIEKMTQPLRKLGGSSPSKGEKKLSFKVAIFCIYDAKVAMINFMIIEIYTLNLVKNTHENIRELYS